jgi:hypothetical protein
MMAGGRRAELRHRGTQAQRPGGQAESRADGEAGSEHDHDAPCQVPVTPSSDNVTNLKLTESGRGHPASESPGPAESHRPSAMIGPGVGASEPHDVLVSDPKTTTNSIVI